MLLRVRKEKCVTFPIQLTEKDYINTRKPSFFIFYPLQFLLLLLYPVQLPLIVHILEELLAVYEKLTTLFSFPSINLGF